MQNLTSFGGVLDEGLDPSLIVDAQSVVGAVLVDDCNVGVLQLEGEAVGVRHVPVEDVQLGRRITIVF